MENKTVTLTVDEWITVCLALFWSKNEKTGKYIPEDRLIANKIADQVGLTHIGG